LETREGWGKVGMGSFIIRHPGWQGQRLQVTRTQREGLT
jgi:hypothetical protein